MKQIKRIVFAWQAMATVTGNGSCLRQCMLE